MIYKHILPSLSGLYYFNVLFLVVHWKFSNVFQNIQIVLVCPQKSEFSPLPVKVSFKFGHPVLTIQLWDGLVHSALMDPKTDVALAYELTGVTVESSCSCSRSFSYFRFNVWSALGRLVSFFWFQKLLSPQSIASLGRGWGFLPCLLGHIHRPWLQGEGIGWANLQGERECHALGGQCLADIQTLGCKGGVTFTDNRCVVLSHIALLRHIAITCHRIQSTSLLKSNLLDI